MREPYAVGTKVRMNENSILNDKEGVILKFGHLDSGMFAGQYMYEVACGSAVILTESADFTLMDKSMNYEFTHELSRDIRREWKEGTDDRKVIAVLEMGCADIELVIERDGDNKSASLFTCFNYEGIGWDSHGYANTDVQSDIANLQSWVQLESYMKDELVKYCEKNNIDYSKETVPKLKNKEIERE